jgi:hypothetical protein
MRKALNGVLTVERLQRLSGVNDFSVRLEP